MLRSSHALILVVATGCGGARAASADLQYGFTVASQRAQLAEAAVGDLQDKVVEMEGILREQGLDRASGQQTMQQVQADVAAIRGSLEELQFAVTQLRTDVDALRVDQETRVLHAELRLAQLEAALGMEPPPPPSLDAGTPTAGAPAGASAGTAATPTPTAPAPAAVEATPAGFTERLALAEKRMEEGKQAVARAILQMALQDDPKNVRAAEATYRVGETWYNEGKWREAAKQFQAVNDEYPKSQWAPWAMLRIGECFDGMGRGDAAKTFYDGVVRNFPSSDAAKEAKKKLAH